MIDEGRLISRLKKAQQEIAMQAMLNPPQRDTYSLGQASGMVIGLEEAVNEIINMVKEDRDGNDQL
jgi:hypothetical protein